MYILNENKRKIWPIRLVRSRSVCSRTASLVKRPGMCNVIKGTGGLRKVRWKRGGSGKSGGVRVIYYWMTEEKQIYMLFVYQKSKQEDLTPEQINNLKTIVERWSDEK